MHVEFFGVPRERAGIASLDVQAGTLGQLWTTLAAQIPALGNLICADRLNGARLTPSVVANLNGDRFVSDPATPLADSDSILILSADAGG
jgi:molybdopterin converting factor small subunit